MLWRMGILGDLGFERGGGGYKRLAKHGGSFCQWLELRNIAPAPKSGQPHALPL